MDPYTFDRRTFEMYLDNKFAAHRRVLQHMPDWNKEKIDEFLEKSKLALLFTYDQKNGRLN